MKTWFTYIAAVIFSLATAFLFADYQIALSTFSLISTYLLRIGTLITIPVIVFSFSSAIASIRKDRLGGYVASSLISWSLITSIILPLVPAFIVGSCLLKAMSYALFLASYDVPVFDNLTALIALVVLSALLIFTLIFLLYAFVTSQAMRKEIIPITLEE